VEHIIYLILLLLSSTFFALLEIQIEGKDGWAGKLPTWRKEEKPKGIFKFIKDPNQPQTGYHTYLWLFIFTMCHFVFVFIKWNLRNEILVISFYSLQNVVEDFLWFVFNPAFGIKKFKKELIPWHTYWFLGIPRNYWFQLPFGIFLYLFGAGLI
jgi:hypothetical protein